VAYRLLLTGWHDGADRLTPMEVTAVALHRAVVFRLCPGTARDAKRRVRLAAIVEASQVNDSIAGIEPPCQHRLHSSLVRREVCPLDPVRSKRKLRIFYYSPMAAKVRVR
jgi:hypothetical protein